MSSVAELKALAQAKPNALNYGTLGPGSYPDLFLKWLNNQWGTSIVGIPYRGGGPIAQALVGGDLQMGKYGSRQLHAAAAEPARSSWSRSAPRNGWR